MGFLNRQEYRNSKSVKKISELVTHGVFVSIFSPFFYSHYTYAGIAFSELVGLGLELYHLAKRWPIARAQTTPDIILLPKRNMRSIGQKIKMAFRTHYQFGLWTLAKFLKVALHVSFITGSIFIAANVFTPYAPYLVMSAFLGWSVLQFRKAFYAFRLSKPGTEEKARDYGKGIFSIIKGLMYAGLGMTVATVFAHLLPLVLSAPMTIQIAMMTTLVAGAITFGQNTSLFRDFFSCGVRMTTEIFGWIKGPVVGLMTARQAYPEADKRTDLFGNEEEGHFFPHSQSKTRSFLSGNTTQSTPNLFGSRQAFGEKSVKVEPRSETLIERRRKRANTEGAVRCTQFLGIESPKSSESSESSEFSASSESIQVQGELPLPAQSPNDMVDIPITPLLPPMERRQSYFF